MQDDKVKKILYNQVSLVIALVGVILGVVTWAASPHEVLSQRVSYLEQNLEYQTKMLEEIKAKVFVIENRQIEVLKAISALEH